MASMLDGWPSLAGKPAISDVMRNGFIRPVTEEDIWEVIKNLKNNRSPGQDGITSSFLKHFWALIKTDVCREIVEFFTLGVMDPSWKETIVVLIPKTPNANAPEHFRPISLCPIFYKIVAKLLVGRLQHILPSLISEEQGAFVQGRQISHQCFLAQEIIHKFRFSAAAAGFMALKIDMTQAYDKEILQSYCSWTGQSINAAKSFVLFNKVTPQWKKARLTHFLGFPRVEEFTYLGIKLALRRLNKSDYADLICKTHTKIQAWGSRHLSLAGRAVLINHSVLASTVFLMSHAQVPKGVLAAVELAARSFLWQRSANNRGMHYVDWASLCKPKNCGGLGFHATTTWSGPLRARFAWEYMQPPQSLFLHAMHGRYSADIFNCPSRRSDSPVIRIIRKGADSLRPISRWRISTGQAVNIMDGRWLMDRVLACWPTIVDSPALDSMFLTELLTPTGTWDRLKLLRYFGPDMVDNIMQVSLYATRGRDELELNFRFSGKSIASLAYSACFPDEEVDLKWLQRLGLRPRERMF
ncbi:hypothetical protein KSP39_PZI007763 [Platanthera zijinensis]|uniref:Reverse transcriptase domain-containing protein n=1 Tax=Platanthera zijinensis TaxID=2320716 RepID=A0AAP0BQ18_9ASPA